MSPQLKPSEPKRRVAPGTGTGAVTSHTLSTESKTLENTPLESSVCLAAPRPQPHAPPLYRFTDKLAPDASPCVDEGRWSDIQGTDAKVTGPAYETASGY
jgi:hypothetical protein